MTDVFAPRELAALEQTTLEVGRYLFDHLASRQANLFQRAWWDERVLDWAMREEGVKTQLFRFIDVLPMLTHRDDVVRHLREYLGEVRDELPGPIRVAVDQARPGSLWGRAMAAAARRNATAHARRFIAGTTTQEVLAAAKRERRLRRAFTLDVLGEAVTSESEADRYLAAYIDLLRGVAPVVNGWPEVPQVDRDGLHAIARVNVSIKLSALDSRFDPIDPAGTTERVASRLTQLLRVAREERAFVNVDMESYRCKDLTLHIFRHVMSLPEFRDTTDVGIVLQCYLPDALADARALRDWARERGQSVWVRLVKGAYWDYETTHARQLGWPVPVYQQKWQSDANFERVTRFVMANHEHLRPALGSHNLRSLAHGIAVARHLGLPPSRYEMQMLYGMADTEKQVLVSLGHRLRIYMPYGELIPGMAYLVRRLLENTSNDSFLRASFAEHVPPETLLANPLAHAPAWRGASDESLIDHVYAPERPTMTFHTAADDAVSPWAAFRNEPPTDFARPAARQAMEQALAEVRDNLGWHQTLWIGDAAVDTEERITSLDPSLHARIVGTTASATAEHVDQAVAAALAAQPAWQAIGAGERARYLRRAAEEMRRRRFELAAWEVFECGKSWREADGDIAEAIDFCEFYATGAVALAQPHGVDVPGEENRFEYLPRGVAGVIAPWNFPLAILTGMTVAALATGNTVVMKPAEQSSIVAALLMEIFRDVELPSGVLNYLPGSGEIAGARLVAHPDVAVIAFTGSRDVGLLIQAQAAAATTQLARSGGRLIKKVIAELGGKNAIIIDQDADLDEAVQGVVQSAFGYQGQKCSACSRAIVLQSVYEPFLARLVDATRSLHVGPAEEPGTQIGPVIDAEAFARVQKYIALGQQEGTLRLAVDVGPLAERGYFIGPHIFTDVAPTSRLAQEEIFGPVLAVLAARDLDEALAIANSTPYALTAGLYSRSPANLARARRELVAGNLYLNRPITGALVCRQPFGGHHMSGIGSKAGGADYLLQFTLARTITENTLRRGFAPPPEGRESTG